MSPDQLALGFLQYVVFLFSTTCHEAAHALVAKWGGDFTAAEGGQVTLSPLPHIKREVFGMVILPILGIVTGNGLIGYASAPYDPRWSVAYPKRSGLMSLAGPAANFSLAIIAGILMRIGLMTGLFVPPNELSEMAIVAPAGTGFAVGAATVLSVFFSLNLLLGCFNLLPVPPLDGFGALSLFTDSDGAMKLMQLRMKMRMFGMMIMILFGSFALSYLYDPTLTAGVRVIYALYRP